jgi:hypothetical protein
MPRRSASGDSRVIAEVVVTMLMLTSVRPIGAQSTPMARPPQPHPLVGLQRSSGSAGTGPFQVSLTLPAQGGGGEQVIPLGRAVTVTFENLTPPMGPGGVTGRRDPGTVVVQFAPDDQQASSIARVGCVFQGGCVHRELAIESVNPGAPGSTSYVLSNVSVTQLQIGSQIIATFSYQSLIARTSTPPDGKQ